MNSARLRVLIHLTILSLVTAVLPSNPIVRSSQREQKAAENSLTFARREEAYRANNLGVALLEQYNAKEAAASFSRALEIDSNLTIARLNLSIALYYLSDSTGAAREAQKVAAQIPEGPHPHYMLGLVARAQNRIDDALAEFQKVLAIDPNDAATNVNVGQLYVQQKKYSEAVAAFRTAIRAEPYNETALYNLGLLLTRTGAKEEGQQLIQRFQRFRQSGAGRSLGTNYLEQGRYAEAIVSTGSEPELLDRVTPDVKFVDATAAMLPAPADPRASGRLASPEHTLGLILKPGDMSDPTRIDLIKHEIAARLGGNLAPLDYDGDGDLDLFVVSPTSQRLYRNNVGRFIDVTGNLGGISENFKGVGVGAVAGDYDNDGKPDLFVIRYGNVSLYHNDGNGKFSDVTAEMGIPVYSFLPSSVAFVDVDHDGDLDIFIAGLADLTKMLKASETGRARAAIKFPADFAGAPNMLLRNNGVTFTDITVKAKVAGSSGHAVAVVPTDYDNRRDVDLLVVNYGAAPELFSNQRDGSFSSVTPDVGLDVPGYYTCVAAGDINKDGYTDFFFSSDLTDLPKSKSVTGAMVGGLFAMSDSRGRFILKPGPIGSALAGAAQFLDYDNDGLLDLVAVSRRGVRIWRNLGNDWEDVSEFALAKELAHGAVVLGRGLSAADLDGDGDIDLIVRGAAGELRVLRNDGGNRNHSIRVNLKGRVSNRSAVEAKIEMRAGSLAQKLEIYSASPAPAPADIIFGLGKRQSPDVVRVLWPAGIVQAETQIATSTAARQGHSITLNVTELDRKPSSCPYLYTWNGRQFEFVTDFMGGGEMGHFEEAGRYNTPDADEYVRIRDDQLQEQNGKFEIRVTNELEEATFVDRLQLLAIAHPAATEVYPHEGMTDPPKPFKLFVTNRVRPPLSAFDDHGRDVLDRIAKLDRRYPDDFRLDRIRGYAEEHTLTMELPRGESRVQSQESKVRLTQSSINRQTLDIGHRTLDRTLLLLTGWTDYAWSSDNVAASQAGKTLRPPALEVKDKSGRWRTVIDNIGIPVGRPQTVTVDLTGKFLSGSRDVRIVTNMRIYWDQILVDTSRGDNPTQVTKLDPLVADLNWRGFSRELTPDGREPFGYNYHHVAFTSPWKVMTGHYTREGNVLELLSESDDIFVISRPGDELRISFDATRLPFLAAGWKRTFLLYANGFSKEMDINSASPDQVAPLPFHGMSRYPYKWPEHYPLTDERRKYIEQYNTRVVTSPVPSINTAIVQR